MIVPDSHPRRQSLLLRERVAAGVKSGFTSSVGLIAHGRGEAFDYLLGEETTPVAEAACRAAAAQLLLAERPVLSVNGNVAALVPEEYVALGKAIPAPIEVNLFYRTPERMRFMEAQMRSHGCENLLCNEDARIGVDSERGKVDARGQAVADVILVPLEDGDRTEALKRAGKFVVTIDLNPLSRTARKADITIVDNIVRCVPLMTRFVGDLRDRDDLEEITRSFDNKQNLRDSLQVMKARLDDTHSVD
ncbi:MAG: phosphopantothenate/pantothenate synthetase [Candidatus Diapherotrites archaeon]|nr:phosphopantothenate/pantothenate synthetase [Candidatus Diapherotrites archaeon]